MQDTPDPASIPDTQRRRFTLPPDWFLVALGAMIGVVTALGAVAFKKVLDIAAEHTSGWNSDMPMWLLPLLPMAGALGAGILVQRYATEARGHGVPEVIDAVYRRGGKIRRRVAIVKAVTSIMTIGSGGSAGAEGPIVQIGSAIGSGVAGALRISREHMTTLLGCGAAAGIASVFNAPLAGVLFVMEILLRDFSLKTFTPIMIASVMSTATTRAILDNQEALFAVQGELASYQFTFPELPSYVLLGLVCAAVAVGFIKLLYATEDVYAKMRIRPTLKPVTGALLLGVLGVGYLGMMHAQGHDEAHVPNFFYNGYSTIESLLDPTLFDASAAEHAADIASTAPLEASEKTSPLMEGEVLSTSLLMLLLLMGCKALGTAFTLGSGGSGGVFAPSLFLGATTGAAFGQLMSMFGLLPDGGSPASYALVGMAAMVAGTTHAPLTAILILFELTNDYKVILPIMIAAVLSTLGAQFLLPDSIYSLKLRRAGLHLGTAADLTILRKMTARQITLVPHVAVRPADPLDKLFALSDIYKIVDFVVIDSDDKYVGLVTGQELRTALIEREAIPYLLVAELVRQDLPTIEAEETLDGVLRKFSETDVTSLALVERTSDGLIAKGLITRGRLMHRYQNALSQR